MLASRKVLANLVGPRDHHKEAGSLAEAQPLQPPLFPLGSSSLLCHQTPQPPPEEKCGPDPVTLIPKLFSPSIKQSQSQLLSQPSSPSATRPPLSPGSQPLPLPSAPTAPLERAPSTLLLRFSSAAASSDSPARCNLCLLRYTRPAAPLPHARLG